MSPQSPHLAQPSHPGLLAVIHPPGSFSSYAVASRSFPSNTLITPITNHTLTSSIAYSSLQVSETEHIELNSDLLYTNHSCDPNVIFDTVRMEVKSIKEIKKGDALCFFYPSTEWDMAQGFECGCKSRGCLGWVNGAKYLEKDVLRGFWLNKHIERLLDERDGEDKENRDAVVEVLKS